MSYHACYNGSLVTNNAQSTPYAASARTVQKTPLPTVPPLLHDVTNGTDSIENATSNSFCVVAMDLVLLRAYTPVA
jgi:hypothetical protein